MKRALFAGSFDPPTLGHLDIIKRAVSICDELIVGVAVNAQKRQTALFTPEEKVKMLQEVVFPISKKIKVTSFEGLVVKFATQEKVDFLIRGLRLFSDFEYEARIALANRKIGNIETVFLMADARHAHISSSLIRELGSYRAPLTEFVPSSFQELIFQRLN